MVYLYLFTIMWLVRVKLDSIPLNKILDSLESLHQREFSLQSSQQRVILASHCWTSGLRNVKKGGLN